MSMTDVLREVGNIEKQVRRFDVELKNKQIRRDNLEGDIQRLTKQRDELLEMTDNLKETVSLAVSKAVESERAKIKELEDQKQSELNQARDDRAGVLKEREIYKDRQEILKEAIKKNEKLSEDLARTQNEANALRDKFQSVIKIIQDVLK